MNVPIPPRQAAAELTAEAVLTPFDPVSGAALIAVGTYAGAETFHIQPEQLPKVLAGLDEVRAKYEFARDKAAQLGNFPAPAVDDVTTRAVQKFCERASGAEGSLFTTAEALIAWVEAFEKAVQAAIRDHQRIDEDNRMGG
ncbi:hypothetical protein SAMN05421805_12675 [Saccharopolyspora antimicrobica]|uniref:Uncharacterized protein n=1 Tax=Saccharopolyspora antimicrobica TaxID=455193 RepID=A0A1I5KDK5_9PSEU|nr:hypothetical protein [Saccharopolyspora antimicrobica]RKT81963.1 hypothetical protein ATL45_0202 [Saccharopolyspora antimicrobica]SFO83089.1 hypothetical protein SAMN05421805_12675 [Saccharopolyspora antimicrobica]